MKPLEIPEQEVARYWDKNANVWADHVSAMGGMCTADNEFQRLTEF
jgi:hypothetical protein